ncbi:cobalamin biosynthesis protein P47K [Akkermansiaceae bacterium]|nr:cobalamin biosynthesis protein P47K [Akkermansiaceae bacterium]
MSEFIFTEAGSEDRRMVLIGGFLGAGKTTLIGHLSRWLERSGLQVGLVTNDQGKGLMDTDSARRVSSPGGVEEITGGCFCCRLDDLVGAVERMDRESRPDVIVAEPVGSCTDLVATVILPLEAVYQVPFTLSPYSVVLDARRALATLGGRRNARDFHRDVGYVYRKQIEEAEWLVVNKTDLLEGEDLQDLESRLAGAYPGKRVFLVSGKSGVGLEEWFAALIGARSAPKDVMEVDYERYARGEAMLGWVNSEARCRVIGAAEDGFDWGAWLMETGGKISEELARQGNEVGHFKMSVETGSRRWRLHQVMSGENPLLHEDALMTPTEEEGRLLVNLRAEGDAEMLESIVDSAFRNQDLVSVGFLNRAAFQPAKPVPTHRIAALAPPLA